ncbi:MAG: hypothetical protein JWO39_1746, partial [Gemmatimonadetes bacterium]|nr:hypothetical protein [Gemmatimonadota bacterium]
MHRISFVAAVAAMLGSAAVASARAQSIAGTPIQFGVMGGLTKPVGDVAYSTRHDWNFGALVLIGSPQSRLNFRVDGQWQQLTGVQPIMGRLTNCLGCQSSNQQAAQRYRVLDLTTNAVFNFAPTSPTSFYLVGGVGAYNERQRDPASGESASATRLGVNAGAGVRFRLGSLQPFVE